MEQKLQNIADSLDELTRSSFDGQEIIDSLNWIGHELKRLNDREEGK